jgi:hypothetical protein
MDNHNSQPTPPQKKTEGGGSCILCGPTTRWSIQFKLPVLTEFIPLGA